MTAFRERMKVQHSTMEQKVRIALINKNIHPLTDEEFCLQSTTPDFYFVKPRIAVYLDGPVHKGKEDRDSRLRELLTKRYGVKVVSIPYGGNSNRECARIIKTIMEALE